MSRREPGPSYWLPFDLMVYLGAVAISPWVAGVIGIAVVSGLAWWWLAT